VGENEKGDFMINCNAWVWISFAYFIIGCLVGYYYGKRKRV